MRVTPRSVLAALGLLLAVSTTARAGGRDNLSDGSTVIFARGTKLVRTDPRGKGETVIATLPDKTTVRALRTDAGGKVLLADLAGTWSWMPLDGSTSTLAQLPCADGPAQLDEDGVCVLCRARKGGSMIVNLVTGKQTPVGVPAPGARLVGMGAGRRLVWADAGGVWSAPPGRPRQAKKVAPESPLREFLPSPDGRRAVGVYAGEVYVDAHHKTAAELLMDFALDGEGARRKAIKDGVPVEWSHDSQWVLVEDHASACIMRATGGQYKCWRGYTAASIAPDGGYALVLGNRDGSKRQHPAKGKGKGKKAKAARPARGKKARKPAPDPDPPSEPEEPDEAGGEGDDDAPADVLVAPPSGPLSLYRAELDGAFTLSPALVARDVDGAAVWVPAGGSIPATQDH